MCVEPNVAEPLSVDVLQKSLNLFMQDVSPTESRIFLTFASSTFFSKSRIASQNDRSEISDFQGKLAIRHEHFASARLDSVFKLRRFGVTGPECLPPNLQRMSSKEALVCLGSRSGRWTFNNIQEEKHKWDGYWFCGRLLQAHHSSQDKPQAGLPQEPLWPSFRPSGTSNCIWA